jgi:hypothetical protein
MAKKASKIKWHEVTPLSKTIALALFIAMPFLGFWVGYSMKMGPFCPTAGIWGTLFRLFHF